MSFSRRHFMGALGVGSVSMGIPRSTPWPTLPMINPGLRPVLAPLPASVAAIPVTADSARSALVSRALAALDIHSARITNRGVMGVVDFSAASHVARLHFVDIGSGRIIAEHLVAHGHGSDPDNSGWVERFSNQPGSNASSNGSFLTSDIYTGKHGRSRRLVGLDPENSLALDRGIVIHVASYVDANMARTQGRIGRSQGCFAVSAAAIDAVLSRLGPGSLIYAGKVA